MAHQNPGRSIEQAAGYLPDTNSNNLEQLVEQYYYLGFRPMEIIQFISSRHGINVKLRSLQRILQSLGLRYRNHQNLSEVIDVIDEELIGTSCTMGYRSMHDMLLKKYKLRTTREIVRQSLRYLDPSGVEHRQQRRLRRRRYSVGGPNYLWHMDGWDKLKTFGLCVHGCIDGFSRRILWLKVSSTNKIMEELEVQPSQYVYAIITLPKTI